MDRVYELLKGNASHIAKQLGVAPSTIGRWKKDTDMVPVGMVNRLAKIKGYSLKIIRQERSFDL